MTDEQEQARIEDEHLAEAQRLRNASGAPSLHMRKDRDSLRDDDEIAPWLHAARRCASILKSSDGCGATIAIIGTWGTGKTQIACLMIDWFSKQHRASKYVRAGKFFRQIDHARKSDGGSEDDVLARLSKPDLLVIDELDKPQESVPRWALLSELIDLRYSTFRHTILMANYTREGFDEQVDPSILSRMDERGELIEIEGVNFRKADDGGTQ